MSKKLPAIQFYPGDWRKDPGVQALDYEYRGIWFEMLLLMHESDQRGKLLLNGNPMPEKALARLLGLDVQKVSKVISTLLDYGVAKKETQAGIIYNDRMVRDEKKRQKKVAAGRKGGLKSRPPGSSSHDDPHDDTHDDHHESGADHGENHHQDDHDKQNHHERNSQKYPPDDSNHDDKQNGSKSEAKQGSSTSTSTSTSTSNNHTYTGEFLEFWELYGIKKGKKKAWLEWKKLTESEKPKIMENVPTFLTHFSSDHYTPRPRKYLYNRYWEDEDYQQPQKEEFKSNKNGPTDSDQIVRNTLEQVSKLTFEDA